MILTNWLTLIRTGFHPLPHHAGRTARPRWTSRGFRLDRRGLTPAPAGPRPRLSPVVLNHLRARQRLG